MAKVKKYAGFTKYKGGLCYTCFQDKAKPNSDPTFIPHKDTPNNSNFKNLILIMVIMPLFYHSFTYAGVLNDFNSYNVNIPDNGASVNSDLSLSGAANEAEISKVKVYYEIRHTYPGDLDVWLTAYYNNSWHDYYLYHVGDLGSSDDIVETRDNIYTWNNASPNQVWYLVVKDRATGNVGYIDFFELWITYEVNHAPTNPSNPDPNDGATEISNTTNIDWSCTDSDGDDIYFTVYLEKNDSSPDVIIKDDLTGSNADPGTLDYNSHYYWKVKADDHEGGVTIGPVWDFYTKSNPNGNLEVTVKNVRGSTVSGAIVKKYDAGWNFEEDTTNNSGIAIWNSITPGDYHLEAYYTGTFLGKEYWASGDATVSAGSTTPHTLRRNYPFIDEGVVFTNYETGTVLVSTSEIESGTTIQATVTVRNNVDTNLGVKVRMILDRSQSIEYDSDLTSQEITILGGKKATYELVYTPNQTGTWYRAFEVITRLVNNNILTTDAWPWDQVFNVFGIPDVELISIDFNNSLYRRNEFITATVELYNNDAINLNDLHLLIDFKDPNGNFTAEYASESFNIPATTTYNTNSMDLWLVPFDAKSGAYEPRIKLVNSSDRVLAIFVGEENPNVPIIPIGNFPILNNIIVKSQQHFNPNYANSIYPVLYEFSIRGLNSISLLVKLDDGEGIWEVLSPIPGMVLYNSSIATQAAQNPLSYDLYSEAQSVAQSLGMNINPWIPTFFDHAQSRFDNQEWLLTNDPVSHPDQDFVDAYIEEVRQYEGSLISEVVSEQYESPGRITLDHFRFTNGQHGAEGINSITNFAQSVKDALPAGTQLAGYVWLPSDTEWSGQDYSMLNPYLDIFSPMLYWQEYEISSDKEIYYAASNYIISKISEIDSVLGSTTTQAKVMPTLSITTSVHYSDSVNQNLDPYAWKKTQLNVLGALADENLVGYDLFFAGNWLWPVYKIDPGQGKWIDWAAYLADLALDNGSLRIAISPQGAIDAGAQWRRLENQTWRNSDYTERGIPVGTYNVEFKEVSGWLTPPKQTVIITRNQTTYGSGTYIPTPRINTNIRSISVLEGESASFNVKLTNRPLSTITITLSHFSGDSDISVSAGSNLEFTTSNWDTYQSVTLSAAEDSDTENGVAIIRCSATGLKNVDVTATEIDNDVLQLIVSTDSIEIAEGGTASFNVRLSQQPPSTLIVTTTRYSGDSDISVSAGSNLEFTTSNWDTYQSVTLSAAEDSDTENGIAIIRCSAENIAERIILALEIDNDTIPPHIVVNKDTITFSAMEIGPPPEIESFVISNSGDNLLYWSIIEDIPWLNVSPTSGQNNNDTISVNITSTNLTPGIYNETLTIESSNADNSPYYISITYELSPGTPSPEWYFGPSINYARHGLDAVEYQNKIYAIGGWGGDIIIEVYNNNQWSKLANLPIGQSGVAAAISDNNIYVFGGYGNLNITQIYNITTNSWTTGPNIPQGLYWSTAETVGDSIFLLGGYYAGAGGLNTLYIFDTNSNSWSEGSNLPVSIQMPASAVINRNIHVFGYGTAGHSGYDSHIMYDISMDTWSLEPTPPISFRAAEAVTIGNKIYLISGYTTTYGIRPYVYVYDTDDQLWNEVDSLNIGRHQHAAVEMDGKIFVIGGRDKDSASLSSVEILNVFGVNSMNNPPYLFKRLGFAAIEEDNFGAIIIPRLENYFADVDSSDHLSFSGLALDTGLDSLIFESGGSQADTTALIVYPNLNFNGDIRIVVTATDDSFASASDTLLLTVTLINDSPEEYSVFYPTVSDTFSTHINSDTNITFVWERSIDVDSEIYYDLRLEMYVNGEYHYGTYLDIHDTTYTINSNELDQWLSDLNLTIQTMSWHVTVFDEDYEVKSSESEFVLIRESLSIINTEQLPESYTLHQNYPNPFNPITTLWYDLPEHSNVTITIYNMLGRQVRTLVNATLDAGFKSVIWDATNDKGKPVSAGVYLYQIQAGEFVQTKKMVLLK